MQTHSWLLTFGRQHFQNISSVVYYLDTDFAVLRQLIPITSFSLQLVKNKNIKIKNLFSVSFLSSFDFYPIFTILLFIYHSFAWTKWLVVIIGNWVTTSLKYSCILLSILTELSNDIVWTLSTLPLISNSPNLDFSVFWYSSKYSSN